MSSEKFSQIKRFQKLPPEVQQWLHTMAESHAFSFQQLNMLTEFSIDLFCWNQGTLEQFYHPERVGLLQAKQAAGKIFQQLRNGYDTLKNGQKQYSIGQFPVEGSAVGRDSELDSDQKSVNQKRLSGERKFPEEQMIEVDLQGKIMGKCPVASEKTRCCNLDTLDAVHQCGFDCSYCSIQSFYHGGQVRFIRNLVSHLDTVKLDPEKRYHIGTGQSSDSLMWGNRFGLLDALYRFAADHPNVVLEMKSKSGRIDYILDNLPPDNMVFTWSLNTPVAIEKEEKGTAPLQKRLESARKLADSGIPVGFHFHPIIWYRGWDDEYGELVSRLLKQFRPEEVVMVSLGTLTFIKPVLKRIRERMLKSSILQMPMEECAGKFSYPFEIKKELFSTVYQLFPESWHQSVYYYMCMEDIDLWQPVFGRSYGSNEEFEMDMLTSYREKMTLINRSR